MTGEEFKEILGRRILSGTGKRFEEVTEYRILEVSESLRFVKVEYSAGPRPTAKKWLDCMSVPVIEVLPATYIDMICGAEKLDTGDSLSVFFEKIKAQKELSFDDF